ncbi:DUF4179 domain-containing protein [Paenibacillus tepidiphilus]|uniref:DUF4179 domain-containing protein n=1 Tax=Paenibacillus tepidiphilus TaxID=2608683 RepID=UPI00123AD3A0|nr:DUF4179 domain-containing protein [Paenibacillus tepidiphilus]
MNGKEERLLQQDASEINQLAEAQPEMKIYEAMRKGVNQGKVRYRKRRYLLGITLSVAAAAAIMLFALPFLQERMESPAANAFQDGYMEVTFDKNWSDSAKFSTASFSDVSLQSAVKNGLIQPVYTSIVQKGFRVEMMGGVTDGRRVLLLYSVKNMTEQTVKHANFALNYGGHAVSDTGASLDITAEDNNILPGQTAYFAYSSYLSPSEDYSKDARYDLTFTEISPQALTASSNKYRTSLSLPFELDPYWLKTTKEVYDPQRTLTVAGQNIQVSQVLYTPLNTYVDVEYDGSNDYNIFQLIEPSLVGTTKGNRKTLNYRRSITSLNTDVYTGEAKATVVLDPSPVGELDAARLQVAGIAAVPKDQMQIVVDINKLEVLEAPDSLLTVSTKTEEGRLSFEHRREHALMENSFSMRLKNTYTDAAGKEHTQEGDTASSSQSNSGNDTVYEELTYNFGPNAGRYPQPLTIEIERYWNPVLEQGGVDLSAEE